MDTFFQLIILIVRITALLFWFMSLLISINIPHLMIYMNITILILIISNILLLRLGFKHSYY